MLPGVSDTGPLDPRLLPSASRLEQALAGRYAIDGEVARGGMGVVWSARHRALARRVALKAVLPGVSTERFLKEARLLARIDSPHVVAVHDFEIVDGTPVLAMEWVDGGSLLDRMRRQGGRIPEAEALPLMRDTAQGMRAAAEARIVHRDLKPSNILLDGAGRACVADFGIARAEDQDASLSLASEVLGTPFYMAPEQWEDPSALDARTDVYSFGATYYHALTGRPPFEGRTPLQILVHHKTEPLVSPRALVPELSERTCGVLERCLAKRAADRFASWDEVLRALDDGKDAVSPWHSSSDADIEAQLLRFASRRELYALRLLGAGEVDTYEFPGGRRLRVLCGDIVAQDAEALVSSDDGSLTMSAGVSRRIREAAGDEVAREARRLAPVRAGRAIVTAGGRLKARYVIHAISLEFSRDKAERRSRDLVNDILASVFWHADALYVERLALPLVGAGSAGLPEDVVLDATFLFLARTLARSATRVREASLVLWA
jgi:O-acetyl-ADP-ribose deacetylase (regulator of RNase III)/tRNA A-37 threonylcarbamoyl transferase component Bud32